MPEGAEFAGPMVRRGARLHANEARLEAGEQFQQLAAANLAPQDGSAVIVNAMNLEDVLRDIQTDGANLHGGGSSLRWWSD